MKMNKLWRRCVLIIVAAGASFALAACNVISDGGSPAGDDQESGQEDYGIYETYDPAGNNEVVSDNATENGNADENAVENERDEFWYRIEIDPDDMPWELIMGKHSFEHTPGALQRQIAPPQVGEEIAIIHTNFGEIHVRLFPEFAPAAVQNFKHLARAGFYDGLIFHRIIENFMVQGGDPLGTGMGGDTIWGMPIGIEVSSNVKHIRGALSMANAGAQHPLSTTSQFFIVQNSNLDANVVAELELLLMHQEDAVSEDGGYVFGDLWPAEFLEHYLEHGGTPFLDFVHTVFGQVFIGMDVVDAMAAVPTDGPPHLGGSDRPLEDVIIERIEIVSFGG